MANEKESPRIKGQKLGFQINGKPVWPDMSSAELSPSSDDSFATFGSILAGGTPMQLKVSGIVSTAATSLWRLLFDNVGKELPFIFAPNGNDVPTSDQPHYIGRVTIKQPPSLPVKINEVSSFDLEMPVVEWSQKVSNG